MNAKPPGDRAVANLLRRLVVDEIYDRPSPAMMHRLEHELHIMIQREHWHNELPHYSLLDEKAVARARAWLADYDARGMLGGNQP